MKKSGFTPKEINLLKGNYRRIGKKHGVSRVYVRALAIGAKPLSTPKARRIYHDLERLLETLKEVSK